MEQTCWRPPSQPSVHFRMERTFGGPSHRKPDQRGIDSTPGRAQQFAADRNTVSSMIYHRSLAIIRLHGWSCVPIYCVLCAASTTWSTAQTQPLTFSSCPRTGTIAGGLSRRDTRRFLVLT